MAASKQQYLLAGKALEKFQGLYRAHWLQRSGGKVTRELEVNMVRDKHNMANIIEHIGHPMLWELIDYYFEHYTNPELMWFLYNYDKILQDKKWAEEDAEKIEQLRKETHARTLAVVKRMREGDTN